MLSCRLAPLVARSSIYSAFFHSAFLFFRGEFLFFRDRLAETLRLQPKGMRFSETVRLSRHSSTVDRSLREWSGAGVEFYRSNLSVQRFPSSPKALVPQKLLCFRIL